MERAVITNLTKENQSEGLGRGDLIINRVGEFREIINRVGEFRDGGCEGIILCFRLFSNSCSNSSLLECLPAAQEVGSSNPAWDMSDSFALVED
jgi:hypothetical protein